MNHKLNFSLGDEVNDRLISKIYPQQKILARTWTDNVFRVWTPTLWVVRNEVAYSTYIYAMSSPYAKNCWPLYWPNIFEEGRVCYSKSILNDRLSPEDAKDFQDPNITINFAVSEFFTTRYHYFDFDESFIPSCLTFPWEYWTRDEYYDHCGLNCTCEDYEGECDYCMSNPPEEELGMYKVDDFFSKLENLSKVDTFTVLNDMPRMNVTDTLESTIHGYNRYRDIMKERARLYDEQVQAQRALRQAAAQG